MMRPLCLDEILLYCNVLPQFNVHMVILIHNYKVAISVDLTILFLIEILYPYP